MPKSNAPQPTKIIEEQPDPFLREGPRSRSWTWAVAVVALGVVILTAAAITYRNPRGAAVNPLPGQGPPITTGSGSTQPPTALPTGGNSSAVPPSAPSSTTR